MRGVAQALALVLTASCALLSGCELVADFDRSKIARDAAPGDGDGDGDGDAMIIDPPDEDGGDEPVGDAATGDDDAG